MTNEELNKGNELNNKIRRLQEQLNLMKTGGFLRHVINMHYVPDEITEEFRSQLRNYFMKELQQAILEFQKLGKPQDGPNDER